MNKVILWGGIGEKLSNSNTQWYYQDRIYDSDHSSPCLATNCNPYFIIGEETNNLRIRKLTPRECFRLMGVKDEDYDNVAKNQSDSSLYHLAGDSIVTTCLMAIIGQMTDKEWNNFFDV